MKVRPWNKISHPNKVDMSYCIRQVLDRLKKVHKSTDQGWWTVLVS